MTNRLMLTHATTTEFLHHFWMAFLSGDPDRANECARQVETLNRAMDRINAVAEDAEAERKKELEKAKQEIRDHFERTGRKKKWNPDAIKGGAKAVKQIIAPTVKAVEQALAEYARALALETAQAQADGS
jgi:transcription initiation factor TFIIH subunit 1